MQQLIFMLTMVLARHRDIIEDVNWHWTAENLAENNNEMEYSYNPNFHIDSRAPSGGMTVIVSEIRNRVEAVVDYEEGTSTREYFSLLGRVCGVEMKISS